MRPTSYPAHKPLVANSVRGHIGSLHTHTAPTAETLLPCNLIAAAQRTVESLI